VRHARAVLAVGLVLLGTAASCLEPTQITVEITTDVKCVDIQGTDMTVGRLEGLDARPVTAQTLACAEGRIGELVVVPSGGDDDTVAIKIVMGFGRNPAECVPPSYGRGCIVARRALRYIPHTRLRLPIFLSATCNGIACGSTETCVGGDCRPATVPDPEACSLPIGCTETTLGPSGDGGATTDGQPPPPPPMPSMCSPPQGVPCASTLPAGWSSLAFATSRAQACPATYTPADVVTKAPTATGVCSCTCQISATDPPSCAKGTFTSMIGATTCDGAGQPYTSTGTGCTAIGTPGAVSAYGRYAAFPLTRGTCLPAVQKNAVETTSPVRGCIPSAECVEDVCRGAPPAGFASCIAHDGDVACPGAPFTNRTVTGTGATVTCGGCATCVNNAICSVATFRFYDDAACATERASRIANGACNPLSTGTAGTNVSRFRYDAIPVGAMCMPTSQPTTAVVLDGQRTICCR
jgi:hypothetical protein